MFGPSVTYNQKMAIGEEAAVLFESDELTIVCKGGTIGQCYRRRCSTAICLKQDSYKDLTQLAF